MKIKFHPTYNRNHRGEYEKVCYVSIQRVVQVDPASYIRVTLGLLVLSFQFSFGDGDRWHE